MAKTKLACLLSAFLLLSLPLFGQYTTTMDPAVMDDPTLCVSNNCWNRVGDGFTVITAAQDNTILGLDSNRVIWQWDYSTEAWDNVHLDPSDNMAYITAGSVSQVYGLTTASSNNVFQLVSGTTWQQVPGNWTCSQISAALDGTLWCIGSGGHTYYFSGSTWHQTSPIWTLSNLAAMKSGDVIGIGPSGDLYGYNASTGAWTDTVLNFTPSQAAGGITVAMDGTIAIVDTAGAVHLSRDAGATYTKIAGAPTVGRVFRPNNRTTYLYPIEPYCSNGVPVPSLAVAEDDESWNYWDTLSFYYISTYAGRTSWVLIGSGAAGSILGPGSPQYCTLVPQSLDLLWGVI